MRAALIGTGQIARQHLACLRSLPDVEIVAVSDLSRGLAECAAERFGVPRWFTDHRTMLATTRPDVVHITTPPTSHFELAMDALDTGAHVVVEKPVTLAYHALEALLNRAEANGRIVVENQNYLFNAATQAIVGRIASGEFGAVTHVDVTLCLDVLGPGSPFSDPNLPHPCLRTPAGVITDFLTHLASLAHLFVGPHRMARAVWSKRSGPQSPGGFDEFRALVEGERGTATLTFSAHTQPDAFWLRIYGERMQATADLFETRLTVRRVRGGPKPLRPLRDGLRESWDLGWSAVGTLWRKLSGGPASYEGLWELLARTYRAIATGEVPPVTARQIAEVNRLISDLQPREAYA